MNSKGFPYVSSYQSYFSYVANLHLFDPIISDNCLSIFEIVMVVELEKRSSRMEDDCAV